MLKSFARARSRRVSQAHSNGARAFTTVLAWGARVSEAFRSRVRETCANLGCDPNHLMAAIASETGESFSASVRNRRSGATGLIQFMPATARGLGTTTDQLAALTVGV